jgi:hypothetical protein
MAYAPYRSNPIGNQRRVERISQAAIEIHVQDATIGFGIVRGIIIDWLREKAGGALPDSILRGGTGELSAIGSQRVETTALSDPVFWAARQDDQNPNFPERTWVTEAALAPKGATQLLLGHRLHCVILGDSAPFSRSIPRFMRDIARTFDVRLDGVGTGLQARRVTNAEDVDDLIDLLVDPDRRHPVIGVSEDMEFVGDSGFVINPDRLASNVFGVAHVCLISRAAAFSLTDRLGRDLSVFHGGVRTWHFPFAVEDIGYSHPLALARRIESWANGGPEGFYRELVDWTLRFSAGRRDAEIMLPPFAQVRLVASRLAREEAERAGKSDRELLDLALKENERLTRELEEQRAEHADMLTLADDDVRRIQTERDEALAEASRSGARISVVTAALQRQRNEPEIPIPDSLAELGDWGSQYLGNGVELLPRAVNAAKKSPFEDVAFVYRVLLLLRDKYVPMRRSGDPGRKAEYEAAREELGLTLTPSFAGSRAGEFDDEYRVKWSGKTRDLDMHFRGNSSRDPRYGFRCYFFWDDDSKSVVIGTVPGHLSTRAT